MSEPIPLYGALPYCQLHFVVPGNGRRFEDVLIARTTRKIRGIVSKHATNIRWEGGHIAEVLNADTNLQSLLSKVLVEEGDIRIDPTENGVRIYGRWRAEYKVRIGREVLEAYDIIAGHVKQYLAELTR